MENNIQIDEGYKIRFRNIIETIKGFFGTVEEKEQEEKDRRVKEIKATQNNSHINRLEKESVEYKVEKIKKSQKNRTALKVEEKELNSKVEVEREMSDDDSQR